MKTIAELDRRFTLREKGKISVICGAAALLWAVFSKIFPLEFYSLFFMSMVGSNILLIFLAAVISVPCCLLFSKLTENNISLIFSLISDIVLMTAAAYVFSIFRYSHPVIVAAAELLHFAAILLVTGFPREESDVKIPYIKRKPAAAIGFSLAHTVISDGLYLFLIYYLTKAFL